MIHKEDYKQDTSADRDRGERTSAMEPLVLSGDSRHRGPLTDLALQLAAASAGFRRSLPAGMALPLADLVRNMNCYYSNLIEGHYTHPVDIERALHNDYSTEPGKRNLQLEAKAHVSVQHWVDEGGVRGRWTTVDAICEIHRRFCEQLPADLLIVTNPETKKETKVVPGELRHEDVRVGNHFAVSPGAVPRFMQRFSEVYGALSQTEKILSAAAAHHRLLWIHPFLDGNGRVARLMSHAALLETLDTGALWSVARGLARRVDDYKKHLIACDQSRRNDLDGRGNLSEEALAAFTTFFLELCLDQVRFMEGLMQPAKLRDRIAVWVEEEIRGGALPANSGIVLEAVLFRGELPRGDVAGLLGTGERHARRTVAALIARGVLVSTSSRAPLSITFPAALASRWMPGLFPDQTST